MQTSKIKEVQDLILTKLQSNELTTKAEELLEFISENKDKFEKVFKIVLSFNKM